MNPFAPLPDNVPSCANCRFFSVSPDGPSQGNCRRYPPVLSEGISAAVAAEDDYDNIVFVVRDLLPWQSPVVRANAWCGEHQSIPGAEQ